MHLPECVDLFSGGHKLCVSCLWVDIIREGWMNRYIGGILLLLGFLLCFSAIALSEGVAVVDTLDKAVDKRKGIPPVQMKAGSAVDSSDEYLLGAGDKIKIHVFGQPDMDVELRLGASGDMRFPFLGKIHISGMTLPALERKIADDLSDGYLVDPQVRVSMEEFRPFYVNGEVKKPGAYPYQPGLTARKAISLAGGLTVDADKNKMFLIHASNIEDEEEVSVLLSAGMRPGDILTIKKSFFYVNGEVKDPGKYSYQSGMTYRMAIAMAGGLKDKSNDDKVYVVHEGRGQKSVHVKNLDAEIKPGDVITSEEGFF